jgi:hypothetical protein
MRAGLLSAIIFLLKFRTVVYGKINMEALLCRVSTPSFFMFQIEKGATNRHSPSQIIQPLKLIDQALSEPSIVSPPPAAVTPKALLIALKESVAKGVPVSIFIAVR